MVYVLLHVFIDVVDARAEVAVTTIDVVQKRISNLDHILLSEDDTVTMGKQREFRGGACLPNVFALLAAKLVQLIGPDEVP